MNFEASVENLDKALDFITGELEKRHCPPNLHNDLCLAAEEIFMNIANYAYKPGCGNASISVLAGTEDKITIKFEDTGSPHNPLEQADPDLDKAPEEREIGGLGVFLVKKLMDDVEYERVENKNILLVTKNIGLV